MKKLTMILLLLSAVYAFPEKCMTKDQCPAQQFCIIDINGRGECISRDRAIQELASGGQEIHGHQGEACATNLDCREDEGLACVHNRGYKTYGVCQ